jgi:hypothetical protein
VRERHLARKLAGPEPGELLDVVGGAGVAVARDEPGQPEHEVVVVRLEVRPEPLDRLDLEPGLLPELARQTRERLFALLEEASSRDGARSRAS